MQNFVRHGDRLDWINDTGAIVASGGLVIVGGLAAVAVADIAAGAAGVLATAGVFEFANKAEVVVAQGDKIYFDADGDPYGGTAGSGCLTTSPKDNAYVGLAWAGAVAASATARVKINERDSDLPGLRGQFLAPNQLTMEDGTVLTKQATTVAGLAQLDNKDMVVLIPTGCTAGEALAGGFGLPACLDETQGAAVSVLVGKAADTDALTLDLEAYQAAAGDIGNADICATDAIAIPEAPTWLTFSLAGLVAGPGMLSCVFTLGGTNDGDAVRIHGARLDYYVK